MRCNLAERRKMSDRRLGRAARWLATALVGLAAVAASSASSLAAAAPQETIRNFYGVLLSSMKNGPTLGIRGRYDQIAPAIEQNFDLSYMLQKTVGLAWRTLADEQKKQVWVAFARYMTATYADRFHSYSGEKFEVTGQQNTPYGTIVESRIVKSNGEPVSINYLMRQNGDEWQVGDIYLTGAISQLATLHSQFASVVEREGVRGLITLLNNKTQAMMASPTSLAGRPARPPAHATLGL
jgi:phospholipid transport system substrate-binding protein